MRRTVVLDVVGLTPALLEHAPVLRGLAARGAMRPLRPVLPAVTCSAQSSFVTGLPPSGHGAVGNGWYVRDLAEIMFWRQSDALVQGEKLWEIAKRRDPDFTCAKLFWWYNMYGAVDWAVTPRPMYPADGRKIPDLHTRPADLRDELQNRLGRFPLFHFWGPMADILSSRWIGKAALQVLATRRPTLTLVYLPHLDYDLQRLGPDDPRIPGAVAEIDAVCAEIVEHAEAGGARIVALSEYGVTGVSGAVYPNRALRRAGLLAVRDEMGRQLLDAGESEAFAVCDHQVAHVYVRNPARLPEVAALLSGLDGVERVLDAEGKRAEGLDHPRAGDLVAISRASRWFAYYHWLDDRRAPDYARTVDIHRKPGYDPAELFIDPALRLPKLRIASRLLGKTLGFRTLMDVIPLDASLVRGSHGRRPDTPAEGPLIISSEPDLLPEGSVDATQVRDILLAHVFDLQPARA
ncbi:MAG: alkaline phosphatase family protein [Alphaproteobacteria bacterium]|nr:alkaline phosphatase family protein [Alphaproteobacteria bacterium]